MIAYNIVVQIKLVCFYFHNLLHMILLGFDILPGQLYGQRWADRWETQEETRNLTWANHAKALFSIQVHSG